MNEDLQPDVDDVLQVEEPAGVEPEVKVRVVGPTRNQPLPRKAGAMFTKLIGTTPVRIVGADHRRASVAIMSEDNLFVATSRAGIVSAFETPDDCDAFRYYGASSPVLECEATVEVWVSAIATTARVSVKTELWATGEGVE